MEDLILKQDIVTNILQEALPKVLKDIFTSGYDNPLKKAVEEEIKSQEGEIKKFVSEMIAKILSDDSFKVKIANDLIGQIIKQGFNK
jgi:uncharacterized membrane protein YheB (UPF0754 family)